MVPEYPSNSNKSKQETHDIPAPVVSEPSTVRKKKDNKYLRMIFAKDFNDVKADLVTQYIEPKIKDLVWGFIQAQFDIAMNGLRMMVYKDYKPIDRAKIPAERYSYANYYPISNNAPARPSMVSEISYDEFSWKEYGSADAVLTGMKDILSKKKFVTVLDMYGLADIKTTNYTLNDWGWYNLDFVEIKGSPDGYILTLPKAQPLK